MQTLPLRHDPQTHPHDTHTRAHTHACMHEIHVLCMLSQTHIYMYMYFSVENRGGGGVHSIRCMHTCVCACVWMHACVRVCVRVYDKCVYHHTHMQTHPLIHMQDPQTHPHDTHTCMHARTDVRVHTHTHTHTHTPHTKYYPHRTTIHIHMQVFHVKICIYLGELGC